MRRRIVSRADLLRAFAEQEDVDDELAWILGFRPRPPPEDDGSAKDGEGLADQARTLVDPKRTADRPRVLVDETPVPFWQPVQFNPENIELPDDRDQVLRAGPPRREKQDPPPHRLLAPLEELVPRLRKAFAKARLGRRPDIPRVVDRIGRGQPLRHIPRRRHVGWGGQLVVLQDRSRHLAPYAHDQAQLSAYLAAQYATDSLRDALYAEIYPRPIVFASDGEPVALDLRPGERLLVLGDLGALSPTPGAADIWRELGERCRELGVAAIALLPCAATDCPEDLHRLYQVLTWEHPAPLRLAAAELAARGEALLDQLALAPLVAPGLLRDIRLSMGPDYPARLESWAWTHLRGGHTLAALADREARERREKLLTDRQVHAGAQRSLGHVRDWLASLPEELWLETVLNVQAAWPERFDAGDSERARALLHYLAHRLEDPAAKPLPARSLAWVQGLVGRLDPALGDDPEVRTDLWKIRSGLEAGVKTPRPGKPENAQIVQHGGEWLVTRGFGESQPGSLLGSIQTLDGLIELGAETRPQWIVAEGEDRYGYWLEFDIAGVRQRLRWIPPGRFRMGSPEDELGRFEGEGPVREVTLAEGFWLFDTPVTQALWEAVMGGNPSEFVSPTRPVERVSFEDANRFIARLNEQVRGLELALPSEAQWEYSCRAGTQSTLYTGPIEILGERNAPALDPIAWYGGNSGEGYELEQGWDSSDWQERQYPHKKAGTHPVGRKQANAWGLYDMLGNVWEWTADHWHASYAGAPADGGVWTEPDEEAIRVMRGGSWFDLARDVRCAYRYRSGPGFRDVFLGFRCARVQDELRPAGVQPARPGAQRPEGAQAGGGQGAASSAFVSESEDARLALPGEGPLDILMVRTDRARLTLRRIDRNHPDLSWVSALGRDRCGLWAEFTHADVVQRLRWIPPGRFMMGSPQDEPGRFEWEGPVHEVTLAEGFWLFATPVTQALWEAVMGDNPSEFVSPTRPVEQVSFEDANRFIARLNEQVPGLELMLPSEAQWEYACRAGTQTALHSGPIEILGERNAPALDPIAWYGGNSGEGFALEQGYDTSDWQEQQYSHDQAGTHPVGRKQANAWGLYDMLGNVWEWTADHWHESYAGAPSDGSAWTEPDQGAVRVLRGGSWFGRARYVRCAYRLRFEPGFRGDGLGFRCARVQGAQAGSATASVREAEPRAPAVTDHAPGSDG